MRERQVNRADALLQRGQGATSKRKSPNDAKRFTTEEIVDTLRSMDFLSSAGFRTDTQIVTRQKMRSIIAQTKKREKDKDNDR